MWNRLRKLLAPPRFEGDEEKSSAARLINSFLIIIIGAAIAFPLLSWLAGTPIDARVGTLVIILIAAAIGLNILLRYGYVRTAGLILTLLWLGMFTYGMYIFGGLHDTAITGLLFSVILASIIGGWQILVMVGGLAMVSMIMIYVFENNGLISPGIEIPSPTIDLVLPLIVVGASTFVLRVIVNNLTQAYQIAQQRTAEMVVTNQELQASRDDLALQAKTLERRSRYLTATAAVARDAVAELDPTILLRRTAALVSEQFDFYHTGIFLIDPGGEFAVLRSASSEGGKRMLARGHRLGVGQEGLVGYVANSGQARVALDTGADAVFFNNPDLPETRSEAALPLRAGAEIIGVLDVQSTEAQAFDSDDIEVLQTLADQVAMSIRTARLYQQAQKSLEAQRRAYGEASQEAWISLIRTRPTIGYQYTRGELTELQETASPPDSQLPKTAVPIRMGGVVIGSIQAHKPGQDELWTNEEIGMLENLSNQLSVALESARLYQDTQRLAAQEQIAGQITSRIRETLDIESILETASKEIRAALDLPEVIIRLGDPATSGTQQRS